MGPLNLPKRDLFRPDEVAAYFDLSVSTIYSWIDQGKLTAYRIGGSRGTIRITREDIERLLVRIAPDADGE
ncbi:MAG: helix-turn-helix domain-containing protein [Pseudomonadota bacterium]